LFTRTAGESGLQGYLGRDEGASRNGIACAAFCVANTVWIGSVELHGLCQPACSSALNGDGRLCDSPQACQCKTIADRGIASFFQNGVTPDCSRAQGYQQIFSQPRSNIGVM